MSYASPAELLVVHALRVQGFADTADVAAATRLDVDAVEAHLADLEAAGLVRHRSEITPEERVARFGQRPCTVLLTGLTAAGKSTIAAGLERRLFDRGRTTMRLDGENIRLGISRDLGFSARDRSENLRRVAEVALLANRQGLIAIAALVAPEADVRARARELIGDHRFVRA